MTCRSRNSRRHGLRAWPLVVAMLATVTCRAADAPASAPAGSGSAAATPTAPARPRIPPPRVAAKPAAKPTAAGDAAAAAPTPGAAPSPSPSAARPKPSDLADAVGQVEAPGPAVTDLMTAKTDDRVAAAGCSTCGGFHSSADAPVFHEAMGCANGQCIPGRKPCYPPPNKCDTVIGAFCQNLYMCLCCPDPCYQPHWVPAAYASFFADYARPRTVTRLRYDNLEDMTRPDRNQFWINGVVPTRNNPRRINNPYARLQQVYIYQEAAGERGSFFIEYPYRQINQSYAPTQAGFSDMNFGVKSLLFDCELLQVAFQFRTYTPTGNSTLNLGTGHFSLDPSILTSVKLGPETYFQGQFGNWIPLAGKQYLAGGVFYWLMSVNQVLCYTTPDSPLIATLEMDGWSFENGGYTAALMPNKNPLYAEKGGGVSYFNIGPGLRQSVCNRLDFGAAITWATTSNHWAQPWFRCEARFLF